MDDKKLGVRRLEEHKWISRMEKKKAEELKKNAEELKKKAKEQEKNGKELKKMIKQVNKWVKEEKIEHEKIKSYHLEEISKRKQFRIEFFKTKKILEEELEEAKQKQVRLLEEVRLILEKDGKMIMNKESSVKNLKEYDCQPDQDKKNEDQELKDVIFKLIR